MLVSACLLSFKAFKETKPVHEVQEVYRQTLRGHLAASRQDNSCWRCWSSTVQQLAHFGLTLCNELLKGQPNDRQKAERATNAFWARDKLQLNWPLNKQRRESESIWMSRREREEERREKRNSNGNGNGNGNEWCWLQCLMWLCRLWRHYNEHSASTYRQFATDLDPTQFVRIEGHRHVVVVHPLVSSLNKVLLLKQRWT